MHDFHESLIWASPDLFTYRGAFHYNSRIYSKVANIIIYERTCRKIVLVSCYSRLNIKCVSHNSVFVRCRVSALRGEALFTVGGVSLCGSMCMYQQARARTYICLFNESLSCGKWVLTPDQPRGVSLASGANLIG